MKQKLDTSILFIFSITLLAVSFTLQYYYQLSPCPLCLLQRLVLGLIAISLGIALIKHANLKAIKRCYYTTLTFSVCGVALAAWQLWLQSQPTQNSGTCLPSVLYLVKHSGIKKTLLLVSNDTGRCSEVVWRFLGLSTPGWTLIAFLILAFGCIRLLSKCKK